jgi:hypothetical protein
MKPIVIDELIKQDRTDTQTSIVINGRKLTGWQLAKPLNYDKEYTTLIERLKGAWLVFICKAIPVQYFCDLTEEQQVEYVKSQLKKP